MIQTLPVERCQRCCDEQIILSFDTWRHCVDRARRFEITSMQIARYKLFLHNDLVRLLLWQILLFITVFFLLGWMQYEHDHTYEHIPKNLYQETHL